VNILLIRPPAPHHAMGLKHVMICEPLELEYVAAGLKGHRVEIFDMILERGLDRRLERFRPDVIGTSSYITGVNEVKKICRTVKRWDSRCVTIVGGVHASLVPEDFADPSVDCIVLGDGTSIMPELVDALEGGQSFDQIPGLVLPGSNGHWERTGEGPYMPPPDSLPFPRRDLVAHLRNRYYYLFHQPVAIMKTTWGCWYRCNFCFPWRVTQGLTYSRSPESIVDELEQIEADDIYIVDDVFLIQPNRLSRIAQLLRERNIRKKYLVYGRSDFIADHEEIIREWAALGLTAVILGLEATTDGELESMDKKCTVHANRRAMEVLRKYGIDTYGSLIPQPDYQPEDWARLRAFIEENGLYYVNISPLTPLPGTLIWSQYADQVTVSRAAHGLWDLSHCVLPTRMPLKKYYRSLLRVYAQTILDIRRANRLPLRTRPSVWSRKYLRLWAGAFKVMVQFLGAHRHHQPRQLTRAMDMGPQVPGLCHEDPRMSSVDPIIPTEVKGGRL
jgi:hopanoid C-3 methylase